MIIIKDEKKINRNASIGRYVSIAGLIVLGLGMWITFSRPELIQLAWGSLFVGFILSQVGIYFGNRWGRRPRPDEHLDAALKGLDDRWALIHYKAPVEHLLVGPGGIWLLKPYHQAGNLSYDAKKNRWKMKGGGAMQAYLRVFAQENIGRPDLEIDSEVAALNRYFSQAVPDDTLPEIKVALVMTNERTQISDDIKDTPAFAVSAKKLKETVRKLSKEKGLSPGKLAALQQAMGLKE